MRGKGKGERWFVVSMKVCLLKIIMVGKLGRKRGSRKGNKGAKDAEVK